MSTLQTTSIKHNASTSNNITLDSSGNVTLAAALTAAGNITAFSDEKLKDDVATLENALQVIAALRGVRYKRKDTGEVGIGVIAQEVQPFVPEVVDQSGEYLSVAYGNMVGMLIEAVKELSTRLEELERKVG